jgi:spore coat polysaccharide biosynthesis protein SpsF (cytidylyltransferase family)
MTDAIIAIQARSTSTRLPNKGFAMIGGMTMAERIIHAAKSSANHCATRNDFQMSVKPVLLIPKGDPLSVYSSIVDVVEGDEEDVLSRFYLAFAKYNPKYVVRLTADCPEIQPFIITKHIDTIRKRQADYVSNVGEEWRTSCDGHDCEVISARLFLWLHENAKDKYDREHVTPLLRRSPPSWAICGAVMMQTDISSLKLSVDDEADLARNRAYRAGVDQKSKIAKMKNDFVVWL